MKDDVITGALTIQNREITANDHGHPAFEPNRVGDDTSDLCRNHCLANCMLC